jgi:hypothetical protein
MTWTVVYRPPAQNELAEIWLNAPNPQAVANAADAIDRMLARNPLVAGESRDGRTRIVIERPLTVLYEVYPDDAMVEVFAVFYWRRRPQ